MADSNNNSETSNSSKSLGWGLTTGALAGLGIAAFIASGLWAVVGVALLCGAAYSAYKTIKPGKEHTTETSIVDKLDTGLSEHNTPEQHRGKSLDELVEEDIQESKRAPHPLKPPEKMEAPKEPAQQSTDWVDSIKRDNSPSAGIG